VRNSNRFLAKKPCNSKKGEGSGVQLGRGALEKGQPGKNRGISGLGSRLSTLAATGGEKMTKGEPQNARGVKRLKAERKQ